MVSHSVFLYISKWSKSMCDMSPYKDITSFFTLFCTFHTQDTFILQLDSNCGFDTDQWGTSLGPYLIAATVIELCSLHMSPRCSYWVPLSIFSMTLSRLNVPSTWSINDVLVFCLFPSPRTEILLPFVAVSPGLLEGHLKCSRCSLLSECNASLLHWPLPPSPLSAFSCGRIKHSAYS